MKACTTGRVNSASVAGRRCGEKRLLGAPFQALGHGVRNAKYDSGRPGIRQADSFMSYQGLQQVNRRGVICEPYGVLGKPILV